MDHDQRFKTLIRTFFAEFLQLFFAKWAGRLDLSHVEWLDKELHSNPPEGPLHKLDLVARVSARQPVDGMHDKIEPWLVLVHIEIESPDQTTDIKARLPHYYHHLRSQYGLPVLPIVVYLNVQLEGIGEDLISEWFWELEIDRFRYLYVGLPGLKAVEYIEGENWLGVALTALMKIPPDRVAWLGAEALRRLSGAPLTDFQRFLLVELVQAYLNLDENQKAEFESMLQGDDYSGVRTMNKTVFEEGIEQGIEKGIEKGIETGRLLDRQEIVLTLLAEHVGPVSAPLRLHIETLSMDDLRHLISRIPRGGSLAELGLSAFEK